MARGSLVYGALTSDRTVITAAAAINALNPFTYIGWFYPTTLTTNRMFMSKSSGGNGPQLVVATTDRLRLLVDRATTDTDYASVNSTLTTNAWQLLCATYNSANGAGLVAHLYRGTLSALATEVSYATQTDGSGAVTDDSARDLVIGNYTGANLALQGRCAIAAVFAVELSLADIQSWQRRPRKTVGANVAKMFCRQGKYGADCIEYTGLTAAVTGATQGDGVPLWQGDGLDVQPFAGVGG